MFTQEPGKPQRLLFDVRQQMINAGRTRHLSKVLSSANIGLKRVDFDPSNAEHRLIFARFLIGGGWRDKMHRFRLQLSSSEKAVRTWVLSGGEQTSFYAVQKAQPKSK